VQRDERDAHAVSHAQEEHGGVDQPDILVVNAMGHAEERDPTTSDE